MKESYGWTNRDTYLCFEELQRNTYYWTLVDNAFKNYGVSRKCYFEVCKIIRRMVIIKGLDVKVLEINVEEILETFNY